MVGRAGCHLCEVAERTVARVCAQAGATWRGADIGELGAAEQRAWTDLVPVVLVDGEVVETLRVDADRLLDLLRRA